MARPCSFSPPGPPSHLPSALVWALPPTYQVVLSRGREMPPMPLFMGYVYVHGFCKVGR